LLNQDVEAARALLDRLQRDAHRGVVGDVELHELGADLGRGQLPALRTARPDVDLTVVVAYAALVAERDSAVFCVPVRVLGMVSSPRSGATSWRLSADGRCARASAVRGRKTSVR
jgi:hypothetical protein